MGAAMPSSSIPDFLSHYYEAAHGPFRNLSDLPLAEAEARLERIRQAGEVFASRRAADYLAIRRDLEDQVRQRFVAKGGRPRRLRPHYMILGACPWLLSWYKEGRELRIPLGAFDPAVVSLTYGDTFPAMRYRDGRPYRGQVYTLAELPGLVAAYGLPQEWNSDGQGGPERYIEAQVWDDEPLSAAIARVPQHES
jgi:hypothetical protein